MIKKFTLTTMLVLMVFCMFAVDYKTEALKYLTQNEKEYALSAKDIADLQVTAQYTDESTGLTHIWFQQTVNGIGYKSSSIAVHFNKDNKVVHATSTGELDIASKVNTTSSSLTAEDALTKVAQYMNVTDFGKFSINSKKSKSDLIFNRIENLTDELVYAKKLYYMDNAGKLKLCWEVYIEEKGHDHVWEFAIDANSGELVKKIDNVVHCKVQPGMYGSNNTSLNIPQPSANRNDDNLNGNDIAASGYRVYPYYTEAPNFGPRVLLSDPWDLTASPYGWHDTNGTAAADFTITRGNNVSAYQDLDANNIIDAGSQPDGTASLTFDYPIDFALPMQTGNNAKAAVTQLFYINNIMHDIYYKYGFTEAAGNFQQNNYSRGGSALDFVQAEAHDGLGFNNANFSTPVDGQKPRMQMYLWDDPTPSVPSTFSITAPGSVAGSYDFGAANFGPCSYNIVNAEPVNALSTGTNPPASWFCNAAANASALVGKVALIDRGSCEFGAKALKAQQSGAIAAIIINRQTAGDSLIPMGAGAVGASVTIPCILVTYATGQLMRNNLPTTRITMTADNCIRIDGDLDNGIVAHEYGHGISTRLAGGPANSSCLINGEQGGEGWSDFFALALTHKPADTKNTARGVGSYAGEIYESTPGAGIRRYPYSYDLSINPQTYADLTANPEVHAIGEIWTAALWDMYWNLIDKYGYSSDLYNGSGTAGNQKAIRLVLEGLKLQVCLGGFLDYRNAILKADSILYAKANYCEIWSAFARRGMGVSASQGSNLIATDQTAAFNVPASCNTIPVTASFNASDTVVCAGGSLTFTNTSTATSGSPDSVRWTLGGGVPSTSTSTPTVTPTFNSVGNFTISLIAYKGGVASAVASKGIRVKLKPTVTVNTPAAICVGQSASLSASGATTYTWTGGLASTQNPTAGPLTTTTTYTVTGTTSGCTGTAVTTVTVNPLPSVTVNTPAAICAGGSASLSASGASSYTWTGGLAATQNPTAGPLTTTTTYTVTGTSSGCTGTAVTTVTVTPLPNVTVNSPAICSGQSANLSASGASSYTWTGGLAATQNPTAGPLTTTTTYTVTGTSSGCTKTAVATVTVTAPPTVTVNSPTICAGQSASLSASGATSYTWTGGLASTQNPSTGPLTTTTTYTVTGTTGCSGTAVAIVTVNPSPTVTVNSATICAGGSASLSASGASSYTWTGGLASTQNPSAGPLTTTTTYTVTGTASGCTGTAVSTVTVTPLPNVTVNSPAICSGQSANLSASGASSYTWTGGLAATQNPNTGPLTVTTTYTVTGTSSGCTKTAVATVTVSSTLNVTVNSPTICAGQSASLSASGATGYTWTGGLASTQNPSTGALTTTTTYTVTGSSGSCSNTAVATVTVNPSPTVTVNSASICSGSSASLSASGASSYTWTGGLASIQNPSAGPLTTTTTYTVTGTTSGCTGTATSTVTVNANPGVSVNSPSICAGESANLSASGASSYTWTGGLASIQNPSAGPLTTTTTYTVTGTSLGCTGTATSTVTVKPVPATPGITQSNDTLYSSTVVSGASYEWYLGASLQATTFTPYLKLTVGGSYTVKVIKDGCTSIASAPFSATLVGIRNSTNSIKVFEVYPNPTEGRLVMNLNLTKSANVQIRIYTPEGRELYTKGYTNTRNVFEEVSMSDYAKGVYIIKLNVDDETYYHKVVKQ